MKTLTPLQALKAAKHNKRFPVIVKMPRPWEVCAPRITDEFSQGQEALAKTIAERRERNSNGNEGKHVACLALCHVSRYGKIEWGCFTPIA